MIKRNHRFNNVSYVNEFKVNSCIADVVIFNNCSTAYEIKTELDSFERLQDQLSVYKNVFEFVYLVIPLQKLKQALDLLDDCTGIITLNSYNVLSYERIAKSNLMIMSKDKMFNCFRPSEYICLHEEITGSLPAGKAAQVKICVRIPLLNYLLSKPMRKCSIFSKDHWIHLKRRVLAHCHNHY
ncbi:sce7726 family protein [Klebsiella pneumoniae]|uniref:Sce7726 family protein n=1 Tax=Klebsiella pneumoniae TaxID=573 RepID=A0A923ELX9_KLEPN|nr:sce7726 family protein [Klebsiella pneumoniae]